jgi:hypothetical protein
MRSITLALLIAALLPASAFAARDGVWLAGDGHVHTCYSHDSWCPQSEGLTGADTFYSSFASVPERFTEAGLKALDFLVISDHDDIRAWSDPAFGSHGVIGVHAYESSLSGGHAHAIGVDQLHPKGDGKAVATNALADAIETGGGIFQANHPGYRGTERVDSCADLEYDEWDSTPMHWRYGFAVQPGMIEVFNPTSLMQPAVLFW